MPIKIKLTRLTVPQAEKDESSQLYVLNKSNPKGNINFVSTDSGNRSVGIQVPITFIPIDLSLFSQKADVLRAPDFRRLVARGFLHIVSTESAEEFLEDERAKKEHERIYQVLNDDSADLSFQAPVDESVNAEPPKSENENINQFAQNILLRATSEDMETLITELEGKLDILNIADIEYLKNNSSSDRLKAWCDEALEVIKES